MKVPKFCEKYFHQSHSMDTTSTHGPRCTYPGTQNWPKPFSPGSLSNSLCFPWLKKPWKLTCKVFKVAGNPVLILSEPFENSVGQAAHYHWKWPQIENGCRLETAAPNYVRSLTERVGIYYKLLMALRSKLRTYGGVAQVRPAGRPPPGKR